MVRFLKALAFLVQLGGFVSCTSLGKALRQNESIDLPLPDAMDVVVPGATGMKRSSEEAELVGTPVEQKRAKPTILASFETSFFQFFRRKSKDYKQLETICEQLKGVPFTVPLNPKITSPPLHFAVVLNDLKALGVIIAHLKPDFNTLDRNGHTALTLAITLRRFEAFSLLAKHSDLRSPLALSGMNAFHVAAMIPDSTEYLQEILSHGVCTTLTCRRNEWNPFIYAALKDFDGNFRFLLNQAQPVEIEDSTNDGLVYLLMEMGDYEKVVIVIKAGFPIDFVIGDRNETILHLAAQLNSSAIIDAVFSTATLKLVQKLTTTTTRGCFKETPLEVAAHSGNLEAVKMLCPVSHFMGNAAILAIDYGHAEIVKYFVEEQQLDFTTVSQAPLPLAYFRGYIEILEYLISRLPLQVFYDTNEECENILQLAVIEEDEDVVVLLLSKGMNPNEYEFGLTGSALAWAVVLGNLNIIEMLLKAGAFVQDLIDPTHFAEVVEVSESNLLELAKNRLSIEGFDLVCKYYTLQEAAREKNRK